MTNLMFTKSHKLANDRYFDWMAQTIEDGGCWGWPDEMEFYTIKDGNFYAHTWRGYKALKRITTKSFHSRIFSNK